jgi:hypothetical protein
MNVSKLSKVELNRAMIWCYGDLHPTIDLVGVEDFGNKILIDMGEGYDYSPDYLTDYNLTMPLAKKHMITIRHYENTTETQDFMWGFNSSHKAPLRSICEVLVMIALEKRA